MAGVPQQPGVKANPAAEIPYEYPGEPLYAGVRLCRASAMRLRAQRREVLPNVPASLRSESGCPIWRLVRPDLEAGAVSGGGVDVSATSRPDPAVWATGGGPTLSAGICPGRSFGPGS